MSLVHRRAVRALFEGEDIRISGDAVDLLGRHLEAVAMLAIEDARCEVLGNGKVTITAGVLRRCIRNAK